MIEPDTKECWNGGPQAQTVKAPECNSKDKTESDDGLNELDTCENHEVIEGPVGRPEIAAIKNSGTGQRLG